MSDYLPPTTYGSPASGASTPPANPGSSPVDDASAAKDKAKDATQAGKQAASEVAQTAGNAAKGVAQQTASHAKELAGKTGQQVNEQAGVQKDALVEALRSVVDQLGGMTENVQQDGVAVELAGKARDRASSAADWLEGRDPGEVLEGIRSFGRERPAVYLAGMLAAGVVAGRLTRGVVAVHTDDDSAHDDSAHDDSAHDDSAHVVGAAPSTANMRPPVAGQSNVTAQHEQFTASGSTGGLYNDTAISSRPTPGHTP